MTPRPGRAGLALTALLAVVFLAGLAGIFFSAARYRQVPEATLSQQLNGLPPLANVVQDQGNSISLPGGHTLWIFADTAKLSGAPQFFVTSSAAVAAGRSLTLRYLTGPSGAPLEFLPRTADERKDQVRGEHYTAVWPTGATALPDGRIIIAYAKYEVRQGAGPRFRFRAGGLYAYRPGSAQQVATRLADDLWSAADGPVASPVYSAGQVYFLRCEHFSCYTLRTTPSQLGNRSSYRWWTGKGWSGAQSARTTLRFGSDVPGRNPSLAFSQALGLFVMADTSGGIQSTTGRLWVARQPQGPWSRAAAFGLPQCPSAGCYTLNVHPDQSAPGTLRVSFATAGIGPYVRVADVPVDVVQGSATPSIRTHSTGSALARN